MRSKTFIRYKFGARDRETNKQIFEEGDVYSMGQGLSQTDEETIAWLKNREKYMPHQKIVNVQCITTEIRDLNYEDIK